MTEQIIIITAIMDKPINERFCKLSSRLPFHQDLSLGEDVDIIINDQRFIGNVVKIEYEDTQEGSVDVIYKIKFLSE